jgi:hypothetical protein
LNNLTDWPAPVIEEWLTFLENFVIIAELLDIEIDQKIEDVPTDFSDNSIPFAKGGFLVEDNPDITWDNILKVLNLNGTITGKNRAKQFFLSGV